VDTIPKPQRRVVQTFTGAPNGKSSEAAHITSESTPFRDLLLFFAEIVTLLDVETNRYCHQFLDNCEDGPSPQRDVTEVEMFAFLALILQMGHTVQDRLEDLRTNESGQKSSFSTCWTWPLSTVTPFYIHVVGKILTQRFSTRPYQRDAGTGWA
jgi:hypothetical protein